MKEPWAQTVQTQPSEYQWTDLTKAKLSATSQGFSKNWILDHLQRYNLLMIYY